MSTLFVKATGTVIAAGIITAIVAAILYFMGLPIFDQTDLAWLFVIGLVSAGAVALVLAVRGIWEG